MCIILIRLSNFIKPFPVIFNFLFRAQLCSTPTFLSFIPRGFVGTMEHLGAFTKYICWWLQIVEHNCILLGYICILLANWSQWLFRLAVFDFLALNVAKNIYFRERNNRFLKILFFFFLKKSFLSCYYPLNQTVHKILNNINTCHKWSGIIF